MHILPGYVAELRPQLVQLASDPKCANPKLEALKELIIEIYNNDPDTKSILFTQTRESTVALKGTFSVWLTVQIISNFNCEIRK